MIGYYAHHRGSGHLHRAQAIARTLAEPITLLSTVDAADTTDFADVVELADDSPGLAEPAAQTAGGQLHWAPYHHPGLRRRMSQLSRWVELARPRAVVVDVSVEVTTLVRLMGVPVVVIAMPGDRSDAAHQTGYRLAERIIAPWTRAVYDPSWLGPFADRVHYVGSFSRFDGRPLPPPPAEDPRRVLVFGGTGGTSLTAAALQRLLAKQPHMCWDVVGAGSQWVDDIWPRLCEADVVVSHAGQNAVAEIAAARRPVVLVPEDRPHDEQLRTAAALAAVGLATVAHSWDDVRPEWLAAPARDADWELWAPSGALAAAAKVIELAATHGVA